MPLTLTDDRLQQYKDEGYVFLGRIMNQDTIEALRVEEENFRRYPLYDDSDAPKARSIFRSQMSAYSQPIRNFGLNGEHVHAMTQLIGPNVVWMYTQFITKFPDADTGKSEFPWHQDFGYGPIDPANGLTVWVALDDVDERNGCVYVHPKSHLRGPIPHKKISEDHWFMDVEVEGDGVPAVLKAGEAVAFHGYTLHRSLLNHTDHPRRGFFMCYVDANCKDGEGRYVVDTPRVYMVAGQADVATRDGIDTGRVADIVKNGAG